MHSLGGKVAFSHLYKCLSAQLLGGQDTILSINITAEFPLTFPVTPTKSCHLVYCPPHSPTYGSPFASTIRLVRLWFCTESSIPHSLKPLRSLSFQLCDSTSLGLLNPGNFKRHGQRSATTFLTDIARSVDVDHSNPNTTSQTNVDHLPHSPTNEKKGSCVEEDKKGVEKKSKKGRKGPEIDDIEGDDDQTTHQTELDQDAAIDPAPFRFKPYELAHMLDPKSIEILEAFGGIDGLCGLGTNADTGLVTNTQHIHSLKSSHKPSPEAGESASKRHGLPNTGASENSDDGEQAEVPMTTDYKLDSSVGESCEPTFFCL